METEVDSFRPASPPSTGPRTVVRFGPEGVRREIMGVVPAAFGPRRADILWGMARARTAHGPICEQLPEVMTDDELAYVMAVWETIPSGSSSFMTAFGAIGRDEVPTEGRGTA